MSTETDAHDASGSAKDAAETSAPETAHTAPEAPATVSDEALIEAGSEPRAVFADSAAHVAEPVEAPAETHVEAPVEALAAAPIETMAEPAPEVVAEPIPEAPAAPSPAPEAAAVAAAASEHESHDHGGRDGGDAEASTGDKVKDEAFEIAKTIVYALLIALVLRIFLFQPFTIPSASMEPNLYEGDYIIVSKWDYGYSKHSIPFSPAIFKGRLFGHEPARGDIVVFKLPRDNKTDYIKRLIGLPGDTVQMLNNQLYVNGKVVPNVHVGKPEIMPPAETQYFNIEQYRETLPGGKVHLMQDFGPGGNLDNTALYTVPQGYYFMMGDNRDNSLDSRVTMQAGGVDYVPAENLVGRARVIMFSWHEGASLWKPWTWFTKLRLSRFFHGLQ
jgi:signal peptidase I